MIQNIGVDRSGTQRLGCACPAQGGTRLCRHGPASAGRTALEDYVRRVFADQHAARVGHLAPWLYSLHGMDGRVQAVAGVRHAAAGPLFLEQYLDRPVEDVLTGITGQSAHRDRIAEIGNLATEGRRSAASLFALLANQLADDGMLWAAFTATRPVRRIFKGMGVPLVVLGKADPKRLADDGTDWGAYYRQSPLVVAGYIPRGRDIIQGGHATAAN